MLPSASVSKVSVDVVCETERGFSCRNRFHCLLVAEHICGIFPFDGVLLFTGVFYAFAIFGPAFGFLMSSSFLRYHTDFLQPEYQFALVLFSLIQHSRNAVFASYSWDWGGFSGPSVERADK